MIDTDKRCGTCVYHGTHVFSGSKWGPCEWADYRLAESKVPAWIKLKRTLMRGDDGTDCNAWERRP